MYRGRIVTCHPRTFTWIALITSETRLRIYQSVHITDGLLCAPSAPSWRISSAGRAQVWRTSLALPTGSHGLGRNEVSQDCFARSTMPLHSGPYGLTRSHGPRRKPHARGITVPPADAGFMYLASSLPTSRSPSSPGREHPGHDEPRMRGYRHQRRQNLRHPPPTGVRHLRETRGHTALTPWFVADLAARIGRDILRRIMDTFTRNRARHGNGFVLGHEGSTQIFS